MEPDIDYDPTTDGPLRIGTPLQKYTEMLDEQKKDCEGIRVPCRACGASASEDAAGSSGGGGGDGGGGVGVGVRLCACKGCAAVRYCNAACQQADWPAHKLVCKILACDRELMVGRPSHVLLR